MSHRLSKWFVIGSALMVALPVVASAQTSRVEGMSIQGDYIKDYTGIYTYLSQVPNVGNLVYGELGNTQTPPLTSDRSVGAVLGNLWDGRFGTWGIHLREQTPGLGQGDAVSSPAPGSLLGSDPNTNTNQSFDLMWGKKFGTTSLGLRLNRSVFKAEGDIFALGGLPGDLSTLSYDLTAFGFPGDPNTTRNSTGFGAGVGFEMNPNCNVELAFNYENRTFEVSDTLGNTFEEDSPASYQLAARMMWQWEPNVLVVPVFKWYSYDLSTSTKVGGSTSSASNTLSGWQVGAAGNWTVGSNDLFVLGATVAQNKLDQEEDLFGAGFANGTVTESMFPQVFAALETHVNSWLTLRFGANKGAFYKIKLEDNDTPAEVKVTASPFDMHIGAGVKLGTLQLDAILANNFPQTLGWLGSGVANGGGYFPKVTATYAF
jgi:opacity protein-like surface antigen